MSCRLPIRILVLESATESATTIWIGNCCQNMSTSILETKLDNNNVFFRIGIRACFFINRQLNRHCSLDRQLFPKHGHYHFLNKASAWFVSLPGALIVTICTLKLIITTFSNRQPATSCWLPVRTFVFESATESATTIWIDNFCQNIATSILETKLALGSFWYLMHKWLTAP